MGPSGARDNKHPHGDRRATASFLTPGGPTPAAPVGHRAGVTDRQSLCRRSAKDVQRWLVNEDAKNYRAKVFNERERFFPMSSSALVRRPTRLHPPLRTVRRLGTVCSSQKCHMQNDQRSPRTPIAIPFPAQSELERRAAAAEVPAHHVRRISSVLSGFMTLLCGGMVAAGCVAISP